MKLLTKELRAKLPKLFSQEKLGKKAIVHCKFFTPWSNWTWYVLEFDSEEDRFFGLVYGMEKEFGYFSLSELKSVKGFGGLGIERDLNFKPKTVAEVEAEHERQFGRV